LIAHAHRNDVILSAAKELALAILRCEQILRVAQDDGVPVPCSS
jgi:hypothetical protein